MAYANPLGDELAIRDLGARYIDAANRADIQDWRATWHSDARWFLLGQEIVGLEAMSTFWLQTMEMLDYVVMALNSSTLDIDGEAASGRTYVTEHLCLKGAEPSMVQGVYDDTYIKLNGEWYFDSRRYHALLQGPANTGSEYHAYPS